MVLEWREREHEDMDQQALRNAPTVNEVTAKWVAEILLYLTYAIQCLPTRVYDKLLGS